MESTLNMIIKETVDKLLEINRNRHSTALYGNVIKEAIEKAITVTRCCTKLKSDVVMSFEDWLKKERITEVKETYYKCGGIELSEEIVKNAFKNRKL